ncbi:MAG: hypothetical protein PUE54_01585 [Bacteroidales bacterium]|nr:hypothetical protein [Bacteroidales bacterium]
MPLPLIFIVIAAATGLTGVGKTVKAVADTHDANKTNEKANDIVNCAKNRLNIARKECGNDLKKLGKTKVNILNSSINNFVRSFGTLKNVNFQGSTGLDEMGRICIDSKEFEELKGLGDFATSIAGGIAAGAMGGALTAFGAYSAAGTFAAASTGTAISTLSGAAATNATLAFFGGGSLAAGGLGVAGGTLILGSLVAGPALAIMGFIVDAKASAAKEEAYSNLAKARKISAELGAASDMCYAISKKCNMFVDLLKKLDCYFKPLIIKLNEAIAEHGTNYDKFNQEQKQATAAAASLAKAIKTVLDTPILDLEGNITYESGQVLKLIKPEEISKSMHDTTSVQTSNAKYRSSNVSGTPELTLATILRKCQYDVSNIRHFEYSEKFARFNWDKLISLVNISYGMNCTIEEYKSHISAIGEKGKFHVIEVSNALGKFIKTYQISLIVEACLIHHSADLQENDVNWDKLISKISNIYGVSLVKSQLFCPGKNKPEDILKRINLKICESESYHKDVFFTASKFKKLMLK